jgi:hypothetical protein
VRIYLTAVFELEEGFVGTAFGLRPGWTRVDLSLELPTVTRELAIEGLLGVNPRLVPVVFKLQLSDAKFL